mmetsp:Transcript_7244/g.16446  ORF Transcript_7244/g.16446 Transcript_7244/m.16446 type:complete len:83 (-) Transcript_7244:1293-1541(-)
MYEYCNLCYSMEEEIVLIEMGQTNECKSNVKGIHCNASQCACFWKKVFDLEPNRVAVRRSLRLQMAGGWRNLYSALQCCILQ